MPMTPFIGRTDLVGHGRQELGLQPRRLEGGRRQRRHASSARQLCPGEQLEHLTIGLVEVLGGVERLAPMTAPRSCPSATSGAPRRGRTPVYGPGVSLPGLALVVVERDDARCPAGSRPATPLAGQQHGVLVGHGRRCCESGISARRSECLVLSSVPVSPPTERTASSSTTSSSPSSAALSGQALADPLQAQQALLVAPRRLHRAGPAPGPPRGGSPGVQQPLVADGVDAASSGRRGQDGDHLSMGQDRDYQARAQALPPPATARSRCRIG